MKGKYVGIIVLVGVVCFCIGGFAIYLYQQQEITSKSMEISDLNTTLNVLNDDLENEKEFNRLFFMAMSKKGDGSINEGYARAYKDEADSSYNSSLFDLGAKYYYYAENFYNYTKENYGTAILFLEQAKDYTTNDKTLDYLDIYIEFLNVNKDLCGAYYTNLDNMRLACSYYTLNEWDKCNEALADANANVDEINDLINISNEALNKMDILCETSWKD